MDIPDIQGKDAISKAQINFPESLLTATASDHMSYDIIFAGGGTTACVAASRLAKADPSLRILILEAGPHIQENVNDNQPEPFPAATFSNHVSQPSKALGDRITTVPAGRCVGGGSRVNFAVYSRAAASDYDDWETNHGNPGWGSNKIISLLNKAETFQASSDPGIHGTSGLIKVSYVPDPPNVSAQFLKSSAEYDKDRPQTGEVNDFHHCNAYGRWPLYLDSMGRLSDVPHNYIYNEMFDNLEIQSHRRVLRVIFNNSRAIGIEHVDDHEGRAKGNPGILVSYASRLIVISAGAFGSPAILERSGIGATSVLKKNKVHQLVDLAGVGENYMDHNAIFQTYIASQDSDSPLDKSTISAWSQTDEALVENGIHAGIKIRPILDDLKTMPEFEKRWKAYFMPSPDKPVLLTGILSGYLGTNPVAGSRKYFSMAYYTAYPASTGHVHIQSGTDAYAPLDFYPGYLDRVEDLAVLRWGYKHTRELARRMESYRGEFEHPDFPKNSEPATSESTQPLAASAPKIHYTPDDDKIIDDFHRLNVRSTAHSCGTCAMKQRDKGGVVDPRLNVYGVLGLKVADMSITPSNVGCNTYNTALAIGEKAAVIIAEDLEIEGVTEE